MNHPRTTRTEPHGIEASINFAKRGQVVKAFVDAQDINSTIEIELESHRVHVEDASSNPDFVSDLDREGFVLVHHDSQVSDFRDENQIKNVYHEEVRAFLKQMLGVDRVEFAYGDGAYRTSDPAESVTRPSSHPHVDASERGVHLDLGARVPGYQDSEHWAVYNLWRVLTPEGPLDYPLGIIDARSIRDDDLVPVEIRYEYDYEGQTLIGETEGLNVCYSPDHRWVYFSRMKRDDVVMFKVFDSDSARNIKVGHVGFQDESDPPDQTRHYRTSYELRAFVSWPDSA